MDDRLQELLQDIQQLEDQLLLELQKEKEEFHYEVEEKRVLFDREIRKQHRRLSTGLFRYLSQSKPKHILTAPLVWLILFPALLLDLSVTLFHAICFPLYVIPRVRRSDYIVIDRHYLRYLNIIERLNCIYCGYFNGLIAYIREIAARVEQYWCPIKHARHTAAFHSRYSNFIDYGDAKQFRQRYESIRGSFSDLKPDDK